MSDDEDSASLCTRFRAVSNTNQNQQRGQIDGRFILSAFVLVVIAGPLAAAAIDMQSNLASTPAFSWFWATMIALLVVAMIVAAVLGLD